MRENKLLPGRRKFLSNALRLALLGSIIAPVQQACKNKKTSSTIPGRQDTTRKNNNVRKKSRRKKWNHESLVINSRSKVIHYPTSRVYHYYDEIKSNHLGDLTLAVFTSDPQYAEKLNKQQSGMILEILSLQQLNRGIDDTKLNAAIDTLAIAFRQEYAKINATNFRIHELMLQLIALNNNIQETLKWQMFSAKIAKPSSLRKRQNWMASETNFNERIKYISERRSDYIARLTSRAQKYS